MTIALKKTKDENNQLLYDLEDIYAWIDYVRRMGIRKALNESIEIKYMILIKGSSREDITKTNRNIRSLY